MVRADAQRNIDALLEAAKREFADAGVDAPVRAIAQRAGVGVGTVYRHFPLRSDLITAVFTREIDACAASAAELAATHPPTEALRRFLLRFTEFVATKQGLGAALHSGDPAYEPLPHYFAATLGPALSGLLDTAATAGEIRTDVDALDLLGAVSNVGSGLGGAARAEQMVGLLVDGMRFRATT